VKGTALGALDAGHDLDHDLRLRAPAARPRMG
jgi:hypothetical protein